MGRNDPTQKLYTDEERKHPELFLTDLIPEERAVKSSDHTVLVAEWLKSRLTGGSLKCPACTGEERMSVREGLTIGDVSYLPIACDSCGHTAFHERAAFQAWLDRKKAPRAPFRTRSEMSKVKKTKAGK